MARQRTTNQPSKRRSPALSARGGARDPRPDKRSATGALFGYPAAGRSHSMWSAEPRFRFRTRASSRTLSGVEWGSRPSKRSATQSALGIPGRRPRLNNYGVRGSTSPCAGGSASRPKRPIRGAADRAPNTRSATGALFCAAAGRRRNPSRFPLLLRAALSRRTMMWSAVARHRSRTRGPTRARRFRNPKPPLL